MSEKIMYRVTTIGGPTRLRCVARTVTRKTDKSVFFLDAYGDELRESVSCVSQIWFEEFAEAKAYMVEATERYLDKMKRDVCETEARLLKYKARTTPPIVPPISAKILERLTSEHMFGDF